VSLKPLASAIMVILKCNFQNLTLPLTVLGRSLLLVVGE